VCALGTIGIRSHQIGEGDARDAVDWLQELEVCGVGTVWVGAAAFLERGALLARETSKIKIASSVASIWKYGPEELAGVFGAIEAEHPGRFLLGIGASHAEIVALTTPDRIYAKPVSTMRAWLEEMDALPAGVTSRRRIIAAIWPRMLALARERALGSHPYLVPPAHTREARAILGPDALLAPALAVVVGTDAAACRTLARRHLNDPYIRLPNYAENWLRHGFGRRDLEHGGSDRLVDAIVPSGQAGDVAASVRAHLDAGADHVALHVVGEDRARAPRAEWRALAEALAPQLGP
jgi:probable F420-dependent oxidoreductase